MGAKTLSEFRTDLTTYALTNRDDLTTAQLTAFVNNAYIDFTTRNQFWGLKVPQSFDFPELKTTDTTRSTVANAAYITAPSRCPHHLHHLGQHERQEVEQHFAWRVCEEDGAGHDGVLRRPDQMGPLRHANLLLPHPRRHQRADDLLPQAPRRDVGRHRCHGY
ncbi:MAG: hypothetical protein MZV70_03240 [Desulfobacterales bacterium]|nr:hypothetical protein [Desulfobacterales bacterium]